MKIGKNMSKTAKAVVYICCSKGHPILVSNNGGTLKIKNKILLLKGHCVLAVCRECNESVTLPLQISKSIDSLPQAALYIL